MVTKRKWCGQARKKHNQSDGILHPANSKQFEIVDALIAISYAADRHNTFKAITNQTRLPAVHGNHKIQTQIKFFDISGDHRTKKIAFKDHITIGHSRRTICQISPLMPSGTLLRPKSVQFRVMSAVITNEMISQRCFQFRRSNDLLLG